MAKTTLSAGAYLPRTISDTFVDQRAICAWLESIGESVRASTTTDRFTRALTWSGMHVYRNGWVCKALDFSDAALAAREG